jgi:hypothetical protein
MKHHPHLNAVLAGIQQAVLDVGKKTGAIALVTLTSDRTPEDTGTRITLIVDMPDAFVDAVEKGA